VTTVAYINGVMASDSMYQDETGVDISLCRSETTELSPPKIVKYEVVDFTLLCGCAGASNLMAATQDFFVKNYSSLSLNNYKMLVLKLPEYLDQYVAEPQRLSDKLQLEVLLVTNQNTYVLHYNIQEKKFYLPHEQFPSIGTGSDYVKKYYNQDTTSSCVEMVAKAAKSDTGSGGVIIAIALDDRLDKDSKLGHIVNAHKEPRFLSNLNLLMGF
jgi:hypothetical protein